MRVIPIIKVSREIMERLEKARPGLVQKQVWVKDSTGRKGHSRMAWVKPDNDRAGEGKGQMSLFDQPEPKKPEAAAPGFEVGKKYRHKQDGWEGEYAGLDSAYTTSKEHHKMNVTKPHADKNGPMGTVGEWSGKFSREDFDEVAEDKKPESSDEEKTNKLRRRVFNAMKREGWLQTDSGYENEFRRRVDAKLGSAKENKPESNPVSSADEPPLWTKEFKKVHKKYPWEMKREDYVAAMVKTNVGARIAESKGMDHAQKYYGDEYDKMAHFGGKKPEAKPADSLFGDLPESKAPKASNGDEMAPEGARLREGMKFKSGNETFTIHFERGEVRALDDKGRVKAGMNYGKGDAGLTLSEIRNYFNLPIGEEKNTESKPAEPTAQQKEIADTLLRDMSREAAIEYAERIAGRKAPMSADYAAVAEILKKTPAKKRPSLEDMPNLEPVRDNQILEIDGQSYKVVPTAYGWRVYVGEGKYKANAAKESSAYNKAKILADFQGSGRPTVGRMKELISAAKAKGEKLYLTPDRAPKYAIGRLEAKPKAEVEIKKSVLDSFRDGLAKAFGNRR